MSSASQVAERDMPFQFRGNSFTMMVLRVIDPFAPRFFPLLEGKIRQAPNFFRNAPVVIDLDELPEDGGGFVVADFVAKLGELRLFVIGYVGGPPAVQQAALALGLVPMPQGRAAKLEVVRASDPTQAPPPPPEPVFRPALVVSEPIRSGQQIYAEKSDLILTASVSAGAEVLADGHIHIYGALRGRALAGISGDASARIFCHSLEAELVSIAGFYRVSEDIETAFLKKPVQIHLGDGFLHIAAL